MIDYKNKDVVNNNITNTDIGDHKLTQIIINGTIYRGDKHPFDVLRQKPAFFGDKQSAIDYVHTNNWYIKTYTTKRPLKLLNISNTPDNILLLRNFFKNYLIPKYDNDPLVKITYILLQVLYGIIPDNMSNLDMVGLDTKFIRQHFEQDINIDKFIYLLDNYKLPTIIPSRTSLRELDQYLVDDLDVMLEQFNIDGIWFSPYENNNANIQDKSKLLCIRVNKDILKRDSQELTCVPSEMCIFKPNESLNIVRLQQNVNNIFIDKDIRQEQHRFMQREKENKYKYKYQKYKAKYLSLQSKLT